jgi:hypothetical protein
VTATLHDLNHVLRYESMLWLPQTGCTPSTRQVRVSPAGRQIQA